MSANIDTKNNMDNNIRGIAYGIGVGPGDPELMTLQAVHRMEECEVIACPGENPRETTAYRIAVQAVPELASKTLLGLSFPMTKDREELAGYHQASARIMEEYLDQGKDVAFLTLGDASVYSTFTYVQAYLEADGYSTQIVSGIPSFCGAAACLNIPLGEWDEPIHILPAGRMVQQQLTADNLPKTGTLVLMKSGRDIASVKNILRQAGMSVCAVENCGMQGQKIYRSLDEIPEDAGYFTLVIAKKDIIAKSDNL